MRGAKLPIFMGIFTLTLSLTLLLIYGLQATHQHEATIQPVGQIGNNWRMVFDDEFHGTSLDLTKWHPNWYGSSDTAITKPVNDHEKECVDPQQTNVRNGELDMTAIQSPCTVNGKTYGYRSGLIMSDGHFNFTFGYMEARIWTPGGGTIADWPGFWTGGQNWPQDGEIDVVEGLGGQSCWHFHNPSDNPGDCANVSNPGSGWHTYAADWERGSITYYYDGVQVGQVTSGVTSSPMYLSLNLAVSSPIVVPATERVDYVRVWQK